MSSQSHTGAATGVVLGLRVDPQLHGVVRRSGDFETRVWTGEFYHRYFIARLAAIDFTGREARCVTQQFFRIRSGYSKADQFGARIFKRDLGAQHEHFQTFESRFQKRGGELQQGVVAAPEQAEDDQHPSLGAAPGGQLAVRRIQPAYVVAELAVEKILRVRAARADQG